MPEDLERILNAREEAFLGVCSTNVIDTAFLANEICGGSEKPVDAGPPITFSFVNPGFQDFDLKVQTTIKNIEYKGQKWVNVEILNSTTGDCFQLASLRDRTDEGKCSIAVFEADNDIRKDYADKVIATKDDHHIPYVYDEEEKEIRYSAEAVNTLYKFLDDPNEDHINQFIKIFRLESLVKLSFEVPLIPNNVEQMPNYLDYLQNALYSKLYLATEGQQILLESVKSKLDNRATDGITSNYTTKVTLTKTGDNVGLIEWNVVFGKSGKYIGEENSLRKPVLIVFDQDGQGSFHYQDDEAELSEDHLNKLKELAKLEGFRVVTSLPKPTLIERIRNKHEAKISALANKAIKEEEKTADDILDDIIYEFGTEDLEVEYYISENLGEALLQLSNHIAYLRSKGEDSVNEWRKLGSIIEFIQNKFEDQIDLLDLGELILPKGNSTLNFLKNAKNIKAEITAPDWCVLRDAENCSDVKVYDANKVFYGAKNIQNSSVFNSFIGFCEASEISNCYVRDSNYAFIRINSAHNCTSSDSEKSFQGGTMLEGCVAINSKEAFKIFIDTDVLERLLPEDGFVFKDCTAYNCEQAFNESKRLGKDRVKYLINCIWESQPGLITKKPHIVVNGYRGKKPQNRQNLLKRIRNKGPRFILGNLESSQ